MAGIGLIICLGGLLASELVEPIPPVVQEEPIPVPQEPQMSELETEFIQPGPPSVEVPVEFHSLVQENPDIYAWIQMPGTPVDYPVFQHFGDDSYYLRRDIHGNYSAAGVLFTEYRYNTTDFSDPVTIIYGHDMADGSMFGSLQTYTQMLTLDENVRFYIYQPGQKLTYQVFAAVPYNNSHILYYHNFQDEKDFTRFFDSIYETRSLYANLNPEFSPEAGDRVVILATCLKGDNTRRFLVMGVLTEDTTGDAVTTELP